MASKSQFFDALNKTGRTRFLTEAASLLPTDNRVHCTSNTANPSYTVALPPVADASGQTIAIRATIANAQAVTVSDAGDSDDWANLTLDTDGDGALLYSDGAKWWVVSNEIV